MTDRQFAVWEGGTLDVAEAWVQAHLLRGRRELAESKPAKALADFEQARNIPDNLPSDQTHGVHGAEIAYWMGVAHATDGEPEKARQSWTEAAAATSRRNTRRGADSGGLDRQVQTYYQALAERELGNTQESEKTMKNLLESAQTTLKAQTESDQSAEQSERATDRNRAAQAHCVAGLAYAGLRESDKAKAEFDLALGDEPDCLMAKVELAALLR
jgi:tetratricopeptide (TPR) repeat protein